MLAMNNENESGPNDQQKSIRDNNNENKPKKKPIRPQLLFPDVRHKFAMKERNLAPGARDNNVNR